MGKERAYRNISGFPFDMFLKGFNLRVFALDTRATTISPSALSAQRQEEQKFSFRPPIY